jgi:hypothetical protein
VAIDRLNSRPGESSVVTKTRSPAEGQPGRASAQGLAPAPRLGEKPGTAAHAARFGDAAATALVKAAADGGAALAAAGAAPALVDALVAHERIAHACELACEALAALASAGAREGVAAAGAAATAARAVVAHPGDLEVARACKALDAALGGV